MNSFRFTFPIAKARGMTDLIRNQSLTIDYSKNTEDVQDDFHNIFGIFSAFFRHLFNNFQNGFLEVPIGTVPVK